MGLGKEGKTACGRKGGALKPQRISRSTGRSLADTQYRAYRLQRPTFGPTSPCPCQWKAELKRERERSCQDVSTQCLVARYSIVAWLVWKRIGGVTIINVHKLMLYPVILLYLLLIRVSLCLIGLRDKP